MYSNMVFLSQAPVRPLLQEQFDLEASGHTSQEGLACASNDFIGVLCVQSNGQDSIETLGSPSQLPH
jgi:hypothetical protein